MQTTATSEANRNANQPDTLYESFMEHYKDELIYLDLKLYILLKIQHSDEAVPAGELRQLSRHMPLMPAQPDGEMEELNNSLALIGSLLQAKIANSLDHEVYLPLKYVADLFGLTPFEEQVVMHCLAVELDRKYVKFYGYLEEDKQLKTATVDLLLKLSFETEEERWTARDVFHPDRTLRRYLLKNESDRGQRNQPGQGLSQTIQLDDRVVSFLMNSADADPRLESFAKLVRPADSLTPLITDERIQNQMRDYTRTFYLQQSQSPKQYVLFYLWGPEGSGKKHQVKHYCQFFRQTVLIVDLRRLLEDAVPFEVLLKQVFLEATLQRALPCFSHFEDLLDEQEQIRKKLLCLLEWLRATPSISFLLSDQKWEPAEPVHPVFIDIPLTVPTTDDCASLWKHFSEKLHVDEGVDWGAMASKFRFTPGQIQLALQASRQLSLWNRLEDIVYMKELHQACYKQIQHKLETKAKRLAPNYVWDQLILPTDQKEELRHACNQMKHRHIVYGQWGFDKRLSYGKGLSMLFSGPPGTGKTMAAEVIASELFLEIYKIDLSQIVSKYIGETEKSLKEIFREAERSHAILFFDESDALFGKRSEVKDSHDKYANMEVSFLLQKMEEYEGISIMTTNLLQNIDEAFIRRINYVIKFPFPDAQHREKIWRSTFPDKAPQHQIDYNFLSNKLEIAGGSIKNIVVSAAFMAAELGEEIGMKHIIQAAKYELKKSGRILVKENWEEYV